MSDANDIELIKARAEEQKAITEASWPRKWGNVIVPAFAALIVATISFAGTQYAAIIADKEKAVENNREALKIYFTHVAQLPPCERSTAAQVSLIQEITNADGLKLALQRTVDCTVRKEIVSNQADTGAALAEGLPSVAEADQKSVGDFTAYIQYPPGRDNDAEALRNALEALGMRVPGAQLVTNAPNESDVRFYHTADRDALAGQLSNVSGYEFEPVVLRQGDLPHGIIEFWLGRT